MENEIGLFKNAFGHQVMVVMNYENASKWRFTLKLQCGDRYKYRSPVDKNILSANYLDATLQQDNEKVFITFRIFASDQCWHGTILMKALFRQIQSFEQKNKIRVHHVMGELSTFDQKNNWPHSIPFYLAVPKRLGDVDGCALQVNAEIHFKGNNYLKRNNIGPIVNDIDAFMNGNEDGYIVYYLE